MKIRRFHQKCEYKFPASFENPAKGLELRQLFPVRRAILSSAPQLLDLVISVSYHLAGLRGFTSVIPVLNKNTWKISLGFLLLAKEGETQEDWVAKHPIDYILIKKQRAKEKQLPSHKNAYR